MIRDLLTPETQADPYVWAAVLAGHAWLGVAGWLIGGWWSVPVYLLFEAVQALAARRLLIWDSVLDACGFCCGALTAAFLWQHSAGLALQTVAACAAVAVTGVGVRRR